MARRDARMLHLLRRLPPGAEVSTDHATWEPVEQVAWLTRVPSAAERERAEVQEYFDRLQALTPRTPATWTLIGLNLLVALALLLRGASFLHPSVRGLVDAGANYGPRVAQGEVWRLATALFLHAGLLHLLFNMQALSVLGSALERHVGTRGLLVVFLGSGLLASAASVALHPLQASVGASGAIFGLGGAMLPVLLRQDRTSMPRGLWKRMARDLAWFVGLNVALGFLVPMIDQVAHVAGLVSGTLLGFLVAHRLSPEGAAGRTRRALVGGLAAVVAVAAAGLLLPRSGPVRGFSQEVLQADREARASVGALRAAAGSPEGEQRSAERVRQRAVLPLEALAQRGERLSGSAPEQQAELGLARELLRLRLAQLEAERAEVRENRPPDPAARERDDARLAVVRLLLARAAGGESARD